jgi:hypothetical protein
VKVSPHPARALDYAPKENEDAVMFKKTNTTYAILRSGRFSLPRGSEGSCTSGCTAVICFAPFIGSTTGLAFEHQREVGSVSG